MKRIYLAITILLAGTAGVLGLNVKSSRLQEQLQQTTTIWQACTQQLATAETDRNTFRQQVDGLRQDLHLQHISLTAPVSPLAPLLGVDKWDRLTPEQRERILAELGVDWHSSDQWLLVSKVTLHYVMMNAFKSGKLTDAVAGVLGMTAEERQQVNDAFNQARDQFAAWEKANLQREGPSGDVLARYTIPGNAALAESLPRQLTSDVNAVLGDERGKLLEQYSEDWGQPNSGYFGGVTNTLTLFQWKDAQNKPRVYFKHELQSTPGFNHGSSAEDPSVISSKNFPGSFKLVFPGGWKDIAQREGFELPPENPPVGK